MSKTTLMQHMRSIQNVGQKITGQKTTWKIQTQKEVEINLKEKGYEGINPLTANVENMVSSE